MTNTYLNKKFKTSYLNLLVMLLALPFFVSGCLQQVELEVTVAPSSIDETQGFSITINGKFSAPIASARLKFNGKEVPIVLGQPTAFDAHEAGTYLCDARVADWLGDVGTITFTVVINKQDDNESPSVAIHSPNNDQVFEKGESIHFLGTAKDAEDGDLSSEISWSSDLDGLLGIGANINIDTLSANDHVVSAVVRDSSSASAIETVNISVVEAKGETTFKIISRGFSSGAKLVEAYVDSALVARVTARGMTIFQFDPDDGSLIEYQTFDTYADASNTEAMVEYIDQVPQETIVMIGVSDEARRTLNDDAFDILEGTLGSQFIRELCYQESWAMITAKDRNVSFKEDLGEKIVTIQASILLPYSLADNPPRAKFSADQRFGEKGSTINFQDFSLDGADFITDWHWDFGDSSTSDQREPDHTFTKSGAFNIKLTVTSSLGSHTEIRKSYISIVEPITYQLYGAAFGPFLSNLGIGDSTAVLTKAKSIDEIKGYYPYSQRIPFIDKIISFRRIPQLRGLDSQFLGDQNANNVITITHRQVEDRAYLITQFAERFATYDARNGLGHTVAIADQLGKKMSLGIWIGDVHSINLEGIEAAKKLLEESIANSTIDTIELIVVGIEAVLRGDVTAGQAISYVNQVQDIVSDLGLQIPVTYVDTYAILLSHPSVINAVDVVYTNIYSYWAGVGVDGAIGYLHDQYWKLKDLAGLKEVGIFETGWPSKGETVGDAIANLQNSCQYALNFVSWARNYGVKYYYFEGFDEKWKESYEGIQGGHFGILYTDGNLKACMQSIFDGDTVDNNWSNLSVQLTASPTSGKEPLTVQLTAQITGDSKGPITYEFCPQASDCLDPIITDNESQIVSYVFEDDRSYTARVKAQRDGLIVEDSVSIIVEPNLFCGNGTCGEEENQCNCPDDCGSPSSTETNCDDGLDNDCDGKIDEADSDCQDPGELPPLVDGYLVITVEEKTTDESSYSLWKLNTNGSNLIRLRNDVSWFGSYGYQNRYSLKISSDAQQIAYAYNDEEGKDFFKIVDALGQDVSTATVRNRNRFPKFDSENSHIIFGVYFAGLYQLFLDGSEVRIRIAPSRTYEHSAIYSFDGSQIVYIHHEYGPNYYVRLSSSDGTYIGQIDSHASHVRTSYDEELEMASFPNQHKLIHKISSYGIVAIDYTDLENVVSTQVVDDTVTHFQLRADGQSLIYLTRGNLYGVDTDTWTITELMPDFDDTVTSFDYIEKNNDVVFVSDARLYYLEMSTQKVMEVPLDINDGNIDIGWVDFSN